MFETKKSVPGRIVNIAKDYIRPIVRGKETKQVEFGPKVNMVQVDGISPPALNVKERQENMNSKERKYKKSSPPSVQPGWKKALEQKNPIIVLTESKHE